MACDDKLRFDSHQLSVFFCVVVESDKRAPYHIKRSPHIGGVLYAAHEHIHINSHIIGFCNIAHANATTESVTISSQCLFLL